MTDIKLTKQQIRGGLKPDQIKKKTSMPVYGYFLLFNGKPINPKPITYKSAIDNLCRLGTKFEPRKKIKNGKKMIFWQDHKGLRIVPNHDPLKV